MIWRLLILVALAAAGRPLDAAERPIDFDTEIIPVLTKSGCNAGACHGAAAGRGGFHLSLLGGDPGADYAAIVEQYEGRRVNFARPDASLVVAKPAGLLEHGGDQRFDEDSPAALRLLEWIAAGAPRDAKRRLVEFRVEPRSALVEHPGGVVRLKTVARFSDVEMEDVSEFTVFTPTDESAVSIDEYQNATIHRRGRHLVVARFLDQVVPIELAAPWSDEPLEVAAGESFIDQAVATKLEQLRIPPSPLASDAVFLRRVSLDLAGALPAPDEALAFLDDSAPDKRSRLVDRLLESDQFVDHWTRHFADLLRIRALPNDETAAETYHAWLRETIAADRPLNEAARDLLTSLGDSHMVGPANFARMVSDARSHAELAGEVFLGVRIGCANCHNHPLDRWTQDDYHGLAAVFARLQRGPVVALASRGAVTNLRTGEPATPKIPGERYLDGDGDHRLEFADWATDPENPLFARATANRLWSWMLGRGLVEPTDDLRATNPATHPELLDQLAEAFTANGFRIRPLLRQIALSETYQRGPATSRNAMDGAFYARALSKPLAPEVLADAIADVTGVPYQYGEVASGTRAVQLVGPHVPAPSLDVLGRCMREAACTSTTSGGGLAGTLHLINGEFVNRQIGDRSGRLHMMLESGAENDEIVEAFYLHALCRRPTQEEADYLQSSLANDSLAARRAAFEDFLWSLLTCREFTTNH